ncbi:sensor histidine kinase [Halarchaeum nitratireducens]|uniref:histidine kinase n=1 Tax=Halarchaeum nitratireducens TaxID=489913 RepID=A0A830GEW8_9EURY|nr:ATP-binding protein [Halarchaeum nitratireducens]GGN21438.1 hypothetical protein GCM10009021_23390 [Halarchaeum nitratireducens]
MYRSRWKRLSCGGSVLLLGLTFLALAIYDIPADVIDEGVPLYLTLLENSLPIVLNLALVGAGVVLITCRRLSAQSTYVIARWSVLSAVSVSVLLGWVYTLQLLEGVFKPSLLFAHTVTVATLVGLGVGVYDSRRRHHRRQVQVENTKISALFTNTSDCIAEIEFVDRSPIIKSVNPAFERTFGYDEEAVTGESIDELIAPPAARARAAEISQRARAAEQFEESEVFRRTATGELRVFRVQSIPLTAETTVTDGYAVYTDISEEHRYSEQLTLLHETTRDLMGADSTSEVVEMAVDATTEIFRFDFVGVYRYDEAADRLVPESYATDEEALSDPRPIPRGEAVAWTVFETGKSELVRDLEIRSTASDPTSPIGSELLLAIDEWGVLVIGSTATDAFDDADYSLAKILAANVEAALERAEREAQLEEKNERLERFASVISHDLRNPLAVAQGYLDLGRGGDEDAFERVESALDRMEQLLDELSTLARQGEEIGALTTVDLGETARAAWEQVATGDADLRVDGSRELQADRNRLQQLLENLFTNAITHGGADLTVIVTPTDEGFAVEDTGDGIEPAERDRIFDSGYTTDASGSGLGLTIVKEIADAHDWAVSVADGDDGGARFAFDVDGRRD